MCVQYLIAQLKSSNQNMSNGVINKLVFMVYVSLDNYLGSLRLCMCSIRVIDMTVLELKICSFILLETCCFLLIAIYFSVELPVIRITFSPGHNVRFLVYEKKNH